MYLHLGNDVVIQTNTIVGIFDIENTSISKHTKLFFKEAQKAKQVYNVTYELPRSFIVCMDEGKETVYLSQIRPATLQKRAGFLDRKD